jgi:hypothetical protein
MDWPKSRMFIALGTDEGSGLRQMLSGQPRQAARVQARAVESNAERFNGWRERSKSSLRALAYFDFRGSASRLAWDLRIRDSHRQTDTPFPWF